MNARLKIGTILAGAALRNNDDWGTRKRDSGNLIQNGAFN